MSMIFLFTTIFMTFIFPILSIPLSVFGMVFAKGKIRKAYAFLLAISLALLAYMWIPDSTMDLYRHHEQVRHLMGFNFDHLGLYIRENLEPVQYMIKFVVAQTQVTDLLQFFVVLCGYFELFWLILDLSDLRQLKKRVVFLLLLYGFFSVKFIDFASGLWFNFAVINIALGIYLEFFKKTKYFQYILYAVAIFSHIGTLYMLLVMLVFDKIKIFRKVKIPVLIGTLVVALSFGGIVILVNNLLGSDSSVVAIINNMYDAYFVNGTQFVELYAGWNFALRWLTLIICIVLATYYVKGENLGNYSNFLLYLTIYIAATMLNAGVFARYGFFIAILSLPLMAEFFMNGGTKRVRLLLFCIVAVVIGMEFSRWYLQVQTSGLLDSIDENITKNVVQIIDIKGEI